MVGQKKNSKCIGPYFAFSSRYSDWVMGWKIRASIHKQWEKIFLFSETSRWA
jgi:hypothetical protein